MKNALKDLLTSIEQLETKVGETLEHVQEGMFGEVKDKLGVAEEQASRILSRIMHLKNKVELGNWW